MTHFAEQWSYRPAQVNLAQLERIRDVAIQLLSTVEFKMGGTLDAGRRVIDYGTSKWLRELEKAVYPQGPSCNENLIDSPSSNSGTGSTVPVTSPVAP